MEDELTTLTDDEIQTVGAESDAWATADADGDDMDTDADDQDADADDA